MVAYFTVDVTHKFVVCSPSARPINMHFASFDLPADGHLIGKWDSFDSTSKTHTKNRWLDDVTQIDIEWWKSIIDQPFACYTGSDEIWFT